MWAHRTPIGTRNGGREVPESWVTYSFSVARLLSSIHHPKDTSSNMRPQAYLSDGKRDLEYAFQSEKKRRWHIELQKR